MRVLDLIAFAKRLPSKLRPVHGAVKAALDMHSALTDLRLAGDFAGRAIELQENSDGFESQFVEDCTLALLSSAIIFYARATKATSRHRKTFDFTAHFDAPEKEAHGLICKLRDDALAHYGPGPIPGEVSLRADYLFMPVGGDAVFFTTRSMFGSKALARTVRGQAQRATIIAQRLLQDREEKMVRGLNALKHDDPSVRAAREASETDLGEAIGDQAMAKEILTGPRVGMRRLSGQVARE